MTYKYESCNIGEDGLPCYHHFSDVSEQEKDDIFNLCCKACVHEDVIEVNGRFMQIYFGPEHDSWDCIYEIENTQFHD